MCILFYTVAHPGYQLILASNRDEFLDRPTAAAEWHCFGLPKGLSVRGDPGDSGERAEGADDGWVLSGRDLQGVVGGTWLGITRDLRIGAITNIRDRNAPSSPIPPSRGLLIRDFLAPPPSPLLPSVHEYLGKHVNQVMDYDGFNALLFKLNFRDGQWDRPDIAYLTNRPKPSQKDLSPGASDQGACIGLSNTPLDRPFPKVTAGEQRMQASLREWVKAMGTQEELVDRMFALLQQTIPLNSRIDVQSCTCLAPTKLDAQGNPTSSSKPGKWGGTRTSTVIAVRNDGEVVFVERDIAVMVNGNPEAGKGERRYVFKAVA